MARKAVTIASAACAFDLPPETSLVLMESLLHLSKSKRIRKRRFTDVSSKIRKEMKSVAAKRSPLAGWRAPIGWSGLVFSAWSASGSLERCFPAQADDIPMRCAA